MKMNKTLFLLGNISLFIGLWLACKSNRLDAEIMEVVRKGLVPGIVQPHEQQQRNLEKRESSDKYRSWSIKLTGYGILLNIIGVML